MSTTVPDEPVSSSDSSMSSSPAMPGGVNLEVSKRPSPPSHFCSIGVPNHEPNTQLRNNAVNPELAAMFIDESDELEIVANVGEWQDVDFNVMLESGCSKHVLPPQSVPGYQIHPTQKCRSCHTFIVANGEPVPNAGWPAWGWTLEVEREGQSRPHSLSAT